MHHPHSPLLVNKEGESLKNPLYFINPGLKPGGI